MSKKISENYINSKEVNYINQGSIQRFPFHGILGLDDAKLALILALLEPTIGGVLLKGPRGSAKTSLVRSLVGIIKNNLNYVELPLSATEDRVVGSLDLESLVKEGKTLLRPGLLAMADGGILYVDEINLLPDALVDLLLDAASSQINIVERDGVSVAHRARFVLVGSMNEEEGYLRPQLLDRFGLSVDVSPPRDPSIRAEIVARRLEFEQNPEEFTKRYKSQENELLKKITKYTPAQIDKEILELASSLVVRSGVSSMRAELSLVKAARAFAYLQGDKTVQESHLLKVLDLVISHRINEPNSSKKDKGNYKDNNFSSFDQNKTNNTLDSHAQNTQITAFSQNRDSVEQIKNDDLTKNTEKDFKENELVEINPLSLTSKTLKDSLSGRKKTGSEATSKRGLHKGRQSHLPTSSLNLYKTAANYALRYSQEEPSERKLEFQDLSFKNPKGFSLRSIVFLLDLSGSMGAAKRIDLTKGALMRYLIDAYHAKDKVSVVAFRNSEAKIVIQPTSSYELAIKKLNSLKIGGNTPLDLGLKKAYELLVKQQRAGYIPYLVIISDGRASSSANTDLSPWEAVEKAAQSIKNLGVKSVVINPGEFLEQYSKKLSTLLDGYYLNIAYEEDPTEKIAHVIEHTESN